MKAFIQHANGLPTNVNTYAALRGFQGHVRFRTPQPDYRVLDACIARYEKAPRGYALDLGVTKEGATLLVEVNDGYSLGSYGLAPVAYANLLSARCSDLVQGSCGSPSR